MSARRTAVLIAGLTVSGAIAGDAAAQAQRAGIVTVATGTVQVARPSAPARPLKFRDDVFVHDRVSTGEHSLARILLGGKAVVTVSERSVVTITEIPGHSIIDLATGRLSLAVARDRMKPGDSVEIRTSVAIAGVRGTVVIAEVTPGSNAAQPSARFTVLKGLVEVNALDPTTRQTLGASTFLAAQQTLLANRSGVTPPTAISRQAAERLGMLFDAPLPAPAGGRAGITESHLTKVGEDLRQMTRATSEGVRNGEGRGRDDRRLDRKGRDGGDTGKIDATTDAFQPELPKSEFKFENLRPDGPRSDGPRSEGESRGRGRRR